MPADIGALQAANSRASATSIAAPSSTPVSQTSPPQSSPSSSNSGNGFFDTIGKIAQGAKSDLGSIASGFGSLITNPFAVGKALPTAIGQQFSDLGTLVHDTSQGNFDTLKSALENHPINSLINAALPFGVAAKGLGLAGKVADVAGAADTAANLSKAGEVVSGASKFVDPFSATAKGVSKTLDLGETIPGIGDRIANIRSGFQNVFSNEAGLSPEVKEARRVFLGQQNLDPALVRKFASDVVEKFPDLTTEEGINVSRALLETDKQIPLDFEGKGPTEIPGLTNREQKAANYFKDYFENALSEAKKAGVEVGSREGYLPLRYEENYQPKKGGEYVQKQINSFLDSNPQYQKVGKQGFQKESQLPREIQQRLITDPEFADKVGLHPITDPRRLATIYEGEKNAAVAQSKFASALSKRPQIKDITTTKVANIPGLENTKFTPREADVISRTLVAFRDPSQWGKVIHGLLDIPNEYAKFGLFSSPTSFTFHTLNISTLAHLAGFSPFNPLTWTKVPDLLRSLDTEDALYQAALKNRVIAGNPFADKPSQLASDTFKEVLEKDGKKEVGSKVKNFLKDQIPTPGNVEEGKTIGQVVLWKYDQLMRLGAFQKLIDKGMGVKDAAETVRNAFVKYDDFTPTEQQIFKRMFFFYPWMKGSLPAVLNSINKNPLALKELQLTNTQSPEASKRGEVEVNGVAAKPSTPVNSTGEAINNPGGFLYSRLNPVLRKLYEISQGKGVDTTKTGIAPTSFDIGYKPQQIFPGVSANPKIASIVNGFLPVIPQLNKVTNAKSTPTSAILSQTGFFPSQKTVPQQVASDQQVANINRKTELQQNRKELRSTSGFKATLLPGIYKNP